MIKTQNLSKNYHGLVAVDDLSFTVEPGEVLGFLGPNGAGKTTTMRMIAGFVIPTAGSGPLGITVGPDSALWFVDSDRNTIGRVTTGP
jgi:ABC-type multidrug transport system ATPase subunit